MDQALSDLRVLDLTHHVAGPYCTRLLADYGADVVKIERPDGGDPSRRLGPFQNDEPHPEKSGLFLHLNANKRGVTLNLKTATGRKIFLDLVRTANIVVENFEPRVMASLGLSYDELANVKPGLVMTSISNFGQTGPYRDFKMSDLMIFAMGGAMYATGMGDREPLKLYDSVAQYQVGGLAAAATMGAAFGATWEGTGQHVDISCMEAHEGSIDRRGMMLVAHEYTGGLRAELRGGLSPGFIPVGVQPCADGYFDITGMVHFWPRIVKMIGDPPELHDPKWTEPGAQIRPELKEEFDQIWIPWVMQRTKREIWEEARAANMMMGPCYSMADLLSDPHFQERGAFSECEHPVMGRVTMTGRPFIMSESPWQMRRAAPLLGQHNQEILGELGYSNDDLVRLREAGAI